MKSEKRVEKYLKHKIEERNGLCYKWRAIDNRGVPDRVCMLPWMGIFFVEVKTLTGKASKAQELIFEKIKESGGIVFIVQGIPGIDKLMEFVDGIKRKAE